jgi:hypothetical protein
MRKLAVNFVKVGDTEENSYCFIAKILLRNICMAEYSLLFKVQKSIHYVIAAITHTFFHLLENEINLRTLSVIVTPQL